LIDEMIQAQAGLIFVYLFIFDESSGASWTEYNRKGEAWNGVLVRLGELGQWERRPKAYPRSSEEPDGYCRPCRVGPHVGRSDGPVRPTRRPSYGPGRPSISSSFQPQAASQAELLAVLGAFPPSSFIQLPLMLIVFHFLFFDPGRLDHWYYLVEGIDFLYNCSGSSLPYK